MITKIHASILYGYNYQLVDNEGNVWDINSLTPYAFKITRNERIPKTIEFEEIGSTYMIMARPIEDLTKEIEGVGVPIVELAKIALAQKFRYDRDFIIEDIYILSTDFGIQLRFKEDYSYYHFAFDFMPDIHRIGFYLIRDNDIRYYLNQPALFNWLHTNLFNLDFPSGTTQNLI